MNPGRDKSLKIEVGDTNFESEVLKSQQAVLVVFWAPWSRPCHILEAALEEVASSCAGQVKVVKINADDNPDISLLYDIQSIPSLLYFVSGSVRARLIGTASKEAIIAKLQGILPSSDPNSNTSKPTV